jgi:hypothetical protein
MLPPCWPMRFGPDRSVRALCVTLALVAAGLGGCAAESSVACTGDGCADAAPIDASETGRPDRETGVGDAADAEADATPDAADAAPGDAAETGPPCTPFAETCNGRDDDCDGLTDEGDGCADACCDPAFVCSGRGGCVPTPCEGMRCGDGSLCCTAGTVCWDDACIVPTVPCEFNDECPLGEFCEPDLARCVPGEGVAECSYVPPPGVFAPAVACRWEAADDGVDPTRVDVVATPIVVNLTDDDGDGITDRRDVPEIVFLAYDYSGDGCCNVAATLRIVSGACGPDGRLQTLASLNAPGLTNDAGIAAGDLDGDGVAELVAIGRNTVGSAERPNGVVAFRRTSPDGRAWEVLWENRTAPTWNVHTRGGATISLANIDGAGPPEVIVGNVVLRGDTGELLWDGNTTPGGGARGMGNNAFLGPSSTVADIDLDGRLEVVAGNTAYSHTGRPEWTFEYTTQNSDCGGNLPCDGFNAVANLDDDPEAEVVIVRLGEVFALEHDGTLAWRARIPRDDCANNESGPPTVADFDGDGFPEVGTASADFYVVLDRNTCDTPDWSAAGCTARNVLWRVPNQDCSSRATGSSVFDFDGDGRAEVVYADETTLRIFDGPTGRILYEDATHRSHTRIEMPVIADVDNDGNAEIVSPRNRSGGGVPGIVVLADTADNWVRTRRVWNQHGYHITNITEDGTIPVVPEENWLDARFNNFRQNVQPDRVFAAPNLTISHLQVDLDGAKCPVEVRIAVQTIVRNDGALTVPPGLPVHIAVRAADVVLAEHTVLTAERLFPGSAFVLTHEFELTEDARTGTFDVVVTADPAASVSECREDDNARTVAYVDCREVAP